MKEGQNGCKTVFDVAPKALLKRSEREGNCRKHLEFIKGQFFHIVWGCSFFMENTFEIIAFKEK